jgi:hypothetical protein
MTPWDEACCSHHDLTWLGISLLLVAFVLLFCVYLVFAADSDIGRDLSVPSGDLSLPDGAP